MVDLAKKLYGLLKTKRDLLNEVLDLCRKEVIAAQGDNWAEFDSLVDQFNHLTKEIDELDILINEVKDKEEVSSKRLQELDIEIQSLVRECLDMQKKTAGVIEQKKVQALGQLRALDQKNDAFKAYNRTSSYYRSFPKFIDNKK